ncbi:replicative DNA helicase [Xanthomonas euvesicatoria]|uniref:Replicative DNA helicase n=4 Tax=Xanthomonas TaxID=338 RepID=A0AB73H3A6_9XANT|nr:MULTISPECIES: replicative DNA helicase [Xanthomonas]MEB1432066.1 replicative DNA helicase [Xanthomonas campestris pv. campestris]AOY69336.1 replicative DNA helicase [Xanthomonas euvesicatoria pv. vesicatoria str. 85-10]APO88706.1 replicative DNA helicase [Xanthomonas euvesicatoria]KLB38578.1 DNA helicase [Xanthomonas euvesicatoria]KLB46010.1 DNA helicase [Xanthomonas euvesicatoria]
MTMQDGGTKRQRGADGDVARLKIPPHSVEAEQSVLGGLMLAPETLDIVKDLLVEEDFYRRDHRLIYRSICELDEKGQPYDAVTMGTWFEEQGQLELVGNGAYMIELASTVPSAANIAGYAKIVRDRARLRELIEHGTEIVNDGYHPGGRETDELIAIAEQRIFSVAEGGRVRHTYTDVTTGLKRVVTTLQERYENDSSIIGIPTGLPEFDEMTAGLQDTDLIIVAARPGMGKSTLAQGFADSAATRSKKAVAIFSMEMSSDQWFLRMVAAESRVDGQRLKTGKLEDEDWAKVMSAMKKLQGLKLFVDDSPALSPDLLRSKARRLKREQDIGLIVVDYLQLMMVPGSKENRATVVADISRSLKALAKELRVPVVALSQLNRSLETRADKRPLMADLRESGGIEQDADVIVFIYRDDYYNKDSTEKGIAELIIGKQRSGPTGTVRARFSGGITKFEPLGSGANDF